MIRINVAATPQGAHKIKKLSPQGVALGVWAKSPISSDERLCRKERIKVFRLFTNTQVCC